MESVNQHEPQTASNKEPCQPLERTNSIDDEPKQPSNILNALDHALQSIDHDTSAQHPPNKKPDNGYTPSVLTSKDVKYLFSGAPHFMLEKGRHNHWYPHALFPWDTGVQSIQDFWDREPLRHESFTLSTLHAHLPVPSQRQPASDTDADGVTRATFDLGIFEVPNMLSMNGKEPGAVGVRHYLELATADAVRYHPIPVNGGDGGNAGDLGRRRSIAKLPLPQAFEALEHMHDAYAACEDPDIELDRHKLLREGSAAWKRIGVRGDIRTRDIVERIALLSEFRVEALRKNKQITILDKESTETLYNKLYSTFLLPPPKKWNYRQQRENLKGQIEVLTRVLAVKGAWFDFSLPEARLRVGQLLWETPPHADGDCLDAVETSSSKNDPDTSKVNAAIRAGLERKWLLLQLLLAAELLVRLDAIVRLAVLRPASSKTQVSVTSHDVRDLDKLRHGKVNWDVLFAQRFSDNLIVRCCPATASETSAPLQRKQSLFSKLGSLRINNQQQQQQQAADVKDSAWDCIVTPLHPERQLQGLSVFAKAIGWPEYEGVERNIRSKLQKHIATPGGPINSSSLYNTPITSLSKRLFGRKDTYTRHPSRRYVVLHTPSPESESNNIGGWLSRTWLTGLVLPGDAINHLLITSLLENDPRALSTLGPVANLFGGFNYSGSTWWSTKSVVGRVLAALADSRVCMGWVRTSLTLTLSTDQDTVNQNPPSALQDTWFEVDVEEVSKNTRIRQGTKLALESHPLGPGGEEEISGEKFSIPVDEDHDTTTTDGARAVVSVDSLVLSTREERVKRVVAAQNASVRFTLDSSSLLMPLTYNVCFISSYTCRPPRGSITHHRHFSVSSPSSSSPAEPSGENKSMQNRHKHHSHLPGHPLHNSYSYKYIPVTSLRADTPAPFLVGQSSKPELSEHDKRERKQPVLVIDARSSHAHEVLARAWCAATGADALIGRVGRTCLACCVREARAVDVGVVIRTSTTTRNPGSTVGGGE
ncbi:hypothetical protein BGW36DRAFT_365332 [Talaromyces proteolyticus]|uniref:Uncharacterized protein n=1 Tax=Talaromyces proteolyticus TaxID=1131652 RepID=A0AAD4KF13_9EURO|nr:uncharacterized protein BGW36DRAFT_365332 [Talaromyces proteolyticus]KAH8689562.1 hypothetical protein BGW36DRAFT_365332 [Talaromyces proteolyticus]